MADNTSDINFGNVTAVKANNAYENPTRYALDFSVIQRDMSKAAQNIGSAVLKQMENRQKIEADLQASYKEYVEKNYLKSNRLLADRSREAINNSINMSYENFINTDQTQLQRNLQSVDEANVFIKMVDQKMASLDGASIDLRDADKDILKWIQEVQKGNIDSWEFKPRQDGSVGLDIELKLRDENGNFTGETVIIPQDEATMQLSSIKDVKETVTSYNTSLDGFADNMQKAIDTSATRGKANEDAIIQSNTNHIFSSVLTDDTKEAIFTNVISRGEEYHPSVNPNTGKKWDSEKEKNDYFTEQDTRFLQHLNDSLRGRLSQPAIQPKEVKPTTIKDTRTDFQKNYRSITPELQSAVINKDEEALSSLAGKTIKVGEGQGYIEDAYYTEEINNEQGLTDAFVNATKGIDSPSEMKAFVNKLLTDFDKETQEVYSKSLYDIIDRVDLTVEKDAWINGSGESEIAKELNNLNLLKVPGGKLMVSYRTTSDVDEKVKTTVVDPSNLNQTIFDYVGGSDATVSQPMFN